MKVEKKKTVKFVITLDENEALELRNFLRSISGGYGAPLGISNQYLNKNFEYRDFFADLSNGLEES